jgi:hypothetical protein
METLEFIFEVRQYRNAFSLVHHSFRDSPRASTLEKQMILQWQQLMTVYIAPSASSEINIPPQVRSKLLEATSVQSPPAPYLLEPAVQSMIQLIKESIIMPFFNNGSQKFHALSLSAPSPATMSVSPDNYTVDTSTTSGVASLHNNGNIMLKVKV